MTASQDAAAWLDQYVTDACSAAVAPVQAALDDANAGVKDRDAIIAGLQQRITELQAALDACQAAKPTPTPVPDAPTLLVGARAKDSTSGATVDLRAAFDRAATDLGPLQVTRVFTGALPAKHVPITPDGVVEIVSYKSATDAAMGSFVASMRPGTLLAFHHEPEGPTDYPDGGAFLTAFAAEHARAHKAGTTLGMISGGYQWRAGGRGADGSFLPPNADWYGIDTYRDGSHETGYGEIVPLAQVDEFQRWYAAVKDRGVPLLVTEYGRGTVGNGEVPSTPAKRAAAIAVDGPYLALLGFTAWCLWYSDYGPDGRSWRFTDADSLAAVRNAPRR